MVCELLFPFLKTQISREFLIARAPPFSVSRDLIGRVQLEKIFKRTRPVPDPCTRQLRGLDSGLIPYMPASIYNQSHPVCQHQYITSAITSRICQHQYITSAITSRMSASLYNRSAVTSRICQHQYNQCYHIPYTPVSIYNQCYHMPYISASIYNRSAITSNICQHQYNQCYHILYMPASI